MDNLSKVSGFIFSLAALVLAASAFIFVMKYDTKSAHALATLPSQTATNSLVFSQSEDGKSLYQWVFVVAQNKWMRWEFTEKGTK